MGCIAACIRRVIFVRLLLSIENEMSFEIYVSRTSKDLVLLSTRFVASPLHIFGKTYP